MTLIFFNCYDFQINCEPLKRQYLKLTTKLTKNIKLFFLPEAIIIDSHHHKEGLESALNLRSRNGANTKLYDRDNFKTSRQPKREACNILLLEIFDYKHYN